MKNNNFYIKYIKRLLDIVLCSFAIVVLSPIYLITAIGVKISDGGPVFYFSDRAGIGGAPFHFYKFRSMYVTNKDKGMCVADAERVFPLGKLIRRLKIDELPQLINVLKGDMSIVGPRPMVASAVSSIYCGKFEPVLNVKPGLTSAASLYDYVYGDKYTDNDAYLREIFPNKQELELMYVERQSFRYDFALVMRTISAIIFTLFKKGDKIKIPEYEEIVKNKAEKAQVNV